MKQTADNKVRQGLYCSWELLQIWGLVEHGRIIHLSFDRQRHRAAAGPGILEYVDGPREEQLAAFLLGILEGNLTSFPATSPFIRQATSFQRLVWAALHRIPFAATRTYGEIAGQLGNPLLARAVGQACNRNPLPLIIPCHRVVARSGPGGFAGGAPLKQRLLAHEQGVLRGGGK